MELEDHAGAPVEVAPAAATGDGDAHAVAGHEGHRPVALLPVVGGVAEDDVRLLGLRLLGHNGGHGASFLLAMPALTSCLLEVH